MQGQGSVVVLLALGFPEAAVDVAQPIPAHPSSSQLSVAGQSLCVLLAAPAKSSRHLLEFAASLGFVRLQQHAGCQQGRAGAARRGVPGHILQPPGWGSRGRAEQDAGTAAAGERGARRGSGAGCGDTWHCRGCQATAPSWNSLLAA